MEVTVFEGELKMGDGKDATLVFAQHFRLVQCALMEKKLTIETEGIQILGPREHGEISSHSVYFDGVHVGKLSDNLGEFTLLPEASAGAHRIEIRVSGFPGVGLCDDFVLKKVVFSCK